MPSSTLIAPLTLRVNTYAVHECDWFRNSLFFLLITKKETDKPHNYYCIIKELHKIHFVSKQAPKPLKINILLYTKNKYLPSTTV